MSGVEIIFLVIALVTLLAAFLVVTTPNLVHAALSDLNRNIFESNRK